MREQMFLFGKKKREKKRKYIPPERVVHSPTFAPKLEQLCASQRKDSSSYFLKTGLGPDAGSARVPRIRVHYLSVPAIRLRLCAAASRAHSCLGPAQPARIFRPKGLALSSAKDRSGPGFSLQEPRRRDCWRNRALSFRKALQVPARDADQ